MIWNVGLAVWIELTQLHQKSIREPPLPCSTNMQTAMVQLPRKTARGLASVKTLWLPYPATSMYYQLGSSENAQGSTSWQSWQYPAPLTKLKIDTWKPDANNFLPSLLFSETKQNKIIKINDTSNFQIISHKLRHWLSCSVPFPSPDRGGGISTAES